MATNNMINSPVLMPSSIGTAGQAILSNGLGGTTFGTPTSSIFFQTTPTGFIGASVTLSASIMAGRVIVNNNVGPCTWAADTGANYTAQFPGLNFGDSFVVYLANTTSASYTFVPNPDVGILGAVTGNGDVTIIMRYTLGIRWEMYIL